jgi:Family of unknown function (DUF6152)
MRAFLFASLALALAAFAGHAEAHHAFSAAYDSNKPFTVTGTVTSVDWVNPHVHINVDSKAEDGAVTSWKFEVGSPNGLMRSGWTRNSLKPGDVVTIEAFRAKDASNVGAAKTITFNGKRMFAGNSNSEAPAK